MISNKYIKKALEQLEDFEFGKISFVLGSSVKEIDKKNMIPKVDLDTGEVFGEPREGFNSNDKNFTVTVNGYKVQLNMPEDFDGSEERKTSILKAERHKFKNKREALYFLEELVKKNYSLIVFAVDDTSKESDGILVYTGKEEEREIILACYSLDEVNNEEIPF
jgi:hypothetical protein